MGALHDTGVKLNSQDKRISHLENKLKQAVDMLDQLENWHRQNNLRLMNVPEKEESGTTMIDFLVKNGNCRLLQVTWGQSERHLRAIDFKLHHFQNFERVQVEHRRLRSQSVT